MSGQIAREHLDRAKALLVEKLLGHSDEDIRFLASISELADDNPAVQAIAAALAKHTPPASDQGDDETPTARQHWTDSDQGENQ